MYVCMDLKFMYVCMYVCMRIAWNRERLFACVCMFACMYVCMYEQCR